MGASKCRFKSQAQAVGPHYVVAAYVLVIGCLPQEPGEVGVGSQKGGIDAYIQALIDATMRVQRVVACIARVRSRERREPLVPVFGRDQIGNQQIAQMGAPEAVAQE